MSARWKPMDDQYRKCKFASGEWPLQHKFSKSRESYELTCVYCNRKFMYKNNDRRRFQIGPKFCCKEHKLAWKAKIARVVEKFNGPK